MRYAQILEGRIHWIFESENDLETLYDQYYCKEDIELIDITDQTDVSEGWLYSNGIFTAPPPPPEPSLDDLKAAKLAEINAWTQQAITGGFVSACTGAPIKYDSDTETQITMQGIALNATSERFTAEYPQVCPCRGYGEGSDVKTVFMLTGEQVLGFCADLSLHIGVCKQRGWQLQAAVDAAKTTEELERITWAE